MPHPVFIKSILRTYKYPLTGTYLLFSLEMLGTLLRPLLLGEAVNGLLAGKYGGLVIMVAIHLLWTLVGTIRHRYDTRTYTNIYTKVVLQFLDNPFNPSDVSRLSAHATLARELVDFLEYDLVYLVEAVYNILGSLILLCFYDSYIVLTCLVIILPVILISRSYGKKMALLQQQKNDELERQVSVIESMNKQEMKSHFMRLRIFQIRISDKEACNFGYMELLVMVTISVSLVCNHYCGNLSQAGDLVGMYAYLLRFTTGLDTIPYLLQRIVSLRDICKRIGTQADF